MQSSSSQPCFSGLIEAPVFRPSADEFTDPLEFVQKVRHLVEPYGVCKIIPPPNWKPQFALSGSVKFRTKKQHLGMVLAGHLKAEEAFREKEAQSSPDSHRRSTRKRLLSASADSNEQVKKKGVLRPCTKCKGSGHKGDMHYCSLCRKGYHEFCVASRDDFGPEWLCKDCQLATGISYGYGDGGMTSIDEYKCKSEEIRQFVCKMLGLDDETFDSKIERAYWELISDKNCNLDVLYGSDVDTGRTGSGFPSKGEYGSSLWNVNNFPRSSRSLLKHIDKKISGVMRPWLYFGMICSTFAWHIEDHHLYSVNFMHHGASKKWYGIRGSDAERFEQVMKQYLPHIFKKEPDLHYQLVTMVPPRVFLENGIQVCTMIQNPGEFMITWPGAYHAGFNYGYNCAESTNFAVEDWIPFGVISMQNYQIYRVKPVFCFEDLVYRLLNSNENQIVKSWLLEPAQYLLSNQTYWRFRAFGSGIHHFEELDDQDEETKDCCICYYASFFSWVECECSETRTGCIQHFRELCDCNLSRKKIYFRVSLSHLADLIAGLPTDEVKDCCLIQKNVSSRTPHVDKSWSKRLSALASIWHNEYKSIQSSDKVFDIEYLKQMILEAERWSWGGKEVDFAREDLFSVKTFFFWLQQFLPDEDEIFEPNTVDDVSVQSDFLVQSLNRSMSERQESHPELLYITLFIKSYIETAKSKSLEELEKVLRIGTNYARCLSEEVQVDQLQLQLENLEKLVEKGFSYVTKARALRRQKNVKLTDVLVFWEQAVSDCPVSLSEIEEVVHKLQSGMRVRVT